VGGAAGGAPARAGGGIAVPPTVPPGAKLYVAVRGDLSPGQQIAQAAHAAQAWVFERPGLARAWREASNTIVVVRAPDAAALEQRALDVLHVLLEVDEDEAHYPVRFEDPDLRDRLGAVALGLTPTAAGVARRMPLAP
jgi:hypothetical protein